MDNTTIADKVTQTTERATTFVKNKIFDIIAVVIVVAMLALSLGVFELREINLNEILNIALETLPFCLATILLNTDYYAKGTFSGKATKTFISVAQKYSTMINNLTGEQIRVLPDFCEEYNTDILLKRQRAVLRRAALSLSEFHDDYAKDDVHYGPLKVLPKKTLRKILTKTQVAAVFEANKVKIKGVNVNVLLSNISNPDITDVGPGEEEMARQRTVTFTVTSFVSILLLTLIGVKNVVEWGWVGLFLIVFKLLYIIARAYMQYFDGYKDITVGLVNHISRKTDIIKEFISSYSAKENFNDNETNGNN